jgi:quercetin dioxygenase-like cupin family protein
MNLNFTVSVKNTGVKIAKSLAMVSILTVSGGVVRSASAATAVQANSVAAISAMPELKNPGSLEWIKTIPALGKDSPEYAILRADPVTKLTMLMFRTPVAVHIKPHTHDLCETHVILVGGTHVFESNGVRYNIENGGFFRAPGGVVHEAWLPAGSQTFNILESGWVVNWLHGGPSAEDINKYPPASAAK